MKRYLLKSCLLVSLSLLSSGVFAKHDAEHHHKHHRGGWHACCRNENMQDLAWCQLKKAIKHNDTKKIHKILNDDDAREEIANTAEAFFYVGLERRAAKYGNDEAAKLLAKNEHVKAKFDVYHELTGKNPYKKFRKAAKTKELREFFEKHEEQYK